MEDVYFFDSKQELIKIVSNELIIENMQEKEITTNKEDLINSTLDITIEYDEELKEAAFIAVQEKNKAYSLYRVLKVKDQENTLSFTGVDFAPDELDGYIIEDIRPQNESIKSVATKLLEGTEWRLGYIEENLQEISSSFYFVSLKEALKHLQTYGCEIEFFCEVDGDGVKDKWLDIKSKIGNESEMRYTYGDKALTIVRELDRSNIYTSIIGRGKGEDVGDGYGKRLEFTDVRWTKSSGNPLNKPKGQNWLEFPQMTELYGIPTKEGKMRKREKVVVFDEEEDAENLLKLTYQELVECSRPLVQFKTTVSSADAIGNTVTIHRYDRDYHYETRIFKLSINRLTGEIEASVGDNLSSSMSRKASNTAANIQKLDETKQTFYEATEIGKYQDDIMRGAGVNGGSVYQVNGIESGMSKSREVYETIYMDGPEISKSSHFMIQNSEGISFKQCEKGQWKTVKEVHNGDSRSAWTLDGVFNADFIKAGTLEGIKIRSVNEKFVVEISDGKIRFLLKEDEEEKEMVAFTPTYVGDQLKGINLAQNNHYSFALSSKDSADNLVNVLEIPETSTGENLQLKLFGRVDIDGELYINGKKVGSGETGGTGGGEAGGWNGQYPDVVKSTADQFAWQAWVTLWDLGYSEEARAGILGNINGEAGSSMNPDTDQIGGPAYGAVQFDGSAYPLIGSPTYNGREYFQRIWNASGVGGDYREMPTQMKVVDWTMYNGQWIGQVNPISVDSYKNIASPENAARAFELNFERPAAAHPERQGFARHWYDKFKGVKQPSSGSYALPVRSGVPVTSWFGPRWGTMHNGIDFGAPLGDPIFAAKAGKVVQSMSTGSSGGFGEYIIVQHDDGYMTGYAHLQHRMKNVGDQVSQGQQLGTCGSTGDSTGPHLHFSIQTGTWGPYENPAPFLGITSP